MLYASAIHNSLRVVVVTVASAGVGRATARWRCSLPDRSAWGCR
jgi:hypothetical protein